MNELIVSPKFKRLFHCVSSCLNPKFYSVSFPRASHTVTQVVTKCVDGCHNFRRFYNFRLNFRRSCSNIVECRIIIRLNFRRSFSNSKFTAIISSNNLIDFVYHAMFMFGCF